MGTPTGRWVLLVTILGSGMAMLDATVVNIALPAIGREFGAGFRTLQWIVNAYALTLAALILLARGSLRAASNLHHRGGLVCRRVAAVWAGPKR
jgi:MFS family permease